MKKRTQELVLEALLVTPGGLTPAQMDAISKEKASDYDSRNCGGFYEMTLANAGLIEMEFFQGPVDGYMAYALTEFGLEVMAGRT
jgi:hypothetical protein